MSVHFPESLWLASVLLSDARATRQDSELQRLAKDHPETNAITIKPETGRHAAEQFSWVPLPYCSPSRCPFLIKSLALSAHVYNSFPSVRQETSFRPWKGSPFLQQNLSSLTMGRTCASSVASTDSYPLDCQGSADPLIFLGHSGFNCY